MLNCSPQSSLPVLWPFWELRGCTAGDITLFKERAGVARSAQIIPAVKQNLIKIESFFFSLRLCHGVFLQSENYKLRTKRTHCCGKQCRRIYNGDFCVAKRLLGSAPNPFDLHFSKMCSLHPLDAEHKGFGHSPTSILNLIFRNRIQKLQVGTSLHCLPQQCVLFVRNL